MQRDDDFQVRVEGVPEVALDQVLEEFFLCRFGCPGVVQNGGQGFLVKVEVLGFRAVDVGVADRREESVGEGPGSVVGQNGGAFCQVEGAGRIALWQAGKGIAEGVNALFVRRGNGVVNCFLFSVL